MYLHDRSKKYGGLHKFDHTRAHAPPGTVKSGLIGTVPFCTKKNSSSADPVVHLGQTGQGSARYLYPHDRSKKYGACQSFDHTRAHTPPGTEAKSGLIGTLHFGTKKILLQPIRSSTSGRPDRIVHRMRVHTTDRKNMVLVSHLPTLEL